jgi:hypothetical protein
MAMVVGVIMLRRSICYDGRWLRGLLYDICSLLRTLRLLIVCARHSCGARRRAAAVSFDDPGRDCIVVVFLDTDETHDGASRNGIERLERQKDLRFKIV